MTAPASQTAEERIRILQPGQRGGHVRVPGQWHLFVRRPEPDTYILVAAWAVPERNDEDPDSFACGCKLEGQSHVHAEHTFRADQIEELIETHRTARAELTGRKPVSFARAERIG